MSHSPIEVAASLGHDLVALIENVREEGKKIHGDITMVPDQIGVAVFNILKKAEANDGTAWRVASAAREFVLEQQRVDGSDIDSFFRLGIALKEGKLNEDGLALCLKVLQIFEHVCGNLGAVGRNGEKLSLLEVAKLAHAEAINNRAIADILNAYGMSIPSIRPQDIGNNFDESPSGVSRRNFVGRVHVFRDKGNVPTSALCAVYTTMARRTLIGSGFGWFGKDGMSLDRLDPDPSILDQNLRNKVLEHLRFWQLFRS